MHERAALRTAIIAQLSGETGAGARVTSARAAPQPGDPLPAISVYTSEETIDEASKKSVPRELKRNPLVQIEGWVSVAAGGDLDAAMDALALEIETAMDSDQFCDGYASESVLHETKFARALDGARPFGCVTLTYEASYRTDLRMTAPPDNFDTMGTTTKIDGVTMPAADDAEDLLEDIHE